MPAWRDLPVEDLSALAQVVRGFHSPDPPDSSTDLGRQVYEDHCAQCHGENGSGDGPAANRFPIAPTDFRTQRASYAASLRAIRDGVEGTPMAPWTSQLSDDEISAVAHFVRGLFKP